ncbi:sugar ABC transporter substrate-binding protein [Streptobacillus notomytis]|uniref:sugar ABC transporter substrate-binding protein n=1 Tax=Streptobacillus notomytis TaxID=1712031 RepID=UPI0008318201|nr:sugar ABC transporter substrate-binding protein [Streptobacillus notomytis]
MNFKKLATSAILMFSLVLSCGSKGEVKAGNGEALTGHIVVQAEDSWVPYYEAAIARVKEKNPEATIDLKVISSFDHIKIIEETNAENEDVADVFAIPLDRIESLHGKDLLASFDAKTLGNKIGGFGDFDNGLGGQLKFNGSYFGFPFNIETLLLGINTKNSAVNGVDLSNLDFAELGPEVAMIPVFNAWWGVSITNGFGVELLGKNGDKFFSDLTKDWAELTPEVQSMFAGLHKYWKASNDKKLPIFDISAVYGFMDDNFKTGKKGSVRISGPWELAAWSGLVGEDLEVSRLSQAKFAGKELKHWKGGWSLVINARNEENMDKLALAEAVIAEVMNPTFAADFYKITGKIMPNVSKEDYAKLDLSELDKKVIVSVIEGYEGAVSRPLFKEWSQVWTTWENALLSWEAKKPATPEDAYKEIQASFKALLTNLGQ